MQGEPTYVGDWNERGILHINQPTDCRCATAQQLVTQPSAIFFNNLDTAIEAGFKEHCSACAEKGAQCEELFRRKTT